MLRNNLHNTRWKSLYIENKSKHTSVDKKRTGKSLVIINIDEERKHYTIVNNNINFFTSLLTTQASKLI